MTRTPRITALFLALLLVVAACGDDDAGGDSSTTAPDAPTTTTTAALPETTTAAPESTTTAAPATTTTAAPAATTTSAPPTSAGAEATAMAKTDAAIAVVPEGWTSTAVDTNTDAGDSDEIYGPCSAPGSFDLTMLDDATAAVSTVMIDAPQDPTTFFPPPSGSIEARVFESAEVAAEAFAVLETVVGSDAGRECLSEQFIALVGEGAPEDAEYEISVAEVVVPGADVGTRLTIGAAVEGIDFEFQFDLVATLDGDCTIYGTFFSFGAEFDEATRDTIYAAATG